MADWIRMGAVDTLNLRPTAPLLGWRTRIVSVVLAVALAAGGFLALHRLAHRSGITVVQSHIRHAASQATIAKAFTGAPGSLRIPAVKKKVVHHRQAATPAVSVTTPSSSEYTNPVSTITPTTVYTTPSYIQPTRKVKRSTSHTSSGCTASTCGSGTESIG